MNGHSKTLGHFKTKEEAAMKYNEFALKLYGEYASLNVVK